MRDEGHSQPRRNNSPLDNIRYNSVWGYWINLATVSIADTGFIFFVLVPGYSAVWPSILGPVFWVLATIFSTIALTSRRNPLPLPEFHRIEESIRER